MRKEKHVNHKRYILMIIGCLLLSFIVECFGFNYKYWINKTDMKNQNIVIEKNQLTLNDIEMDGDNFKIIGDDPYFKIQYNGYCNYLCVVTSQKQDEYHINVQHLRKGQIIDEKNHVIGTIYKDKSVLELKDNINNIKFIPQVANSKDGDAVFSIKKLYIENSFILNYYRFIAIFISGILILSIVWFWKYLSEEIHITFLLLVLCIGAIVAVINPPYYSFDEREHFVRAYETANFDFELFGTKEIGWIDNSDSFLQRADYTRLAHQNIAEKNNYMDKFGSSECDNYKHYDSTAATYPFVPYLPGAVGILIGRLLNLSFAWCFYLGRITSLLGYAIICCWCIKHIKIWKNTLFACSLLPALFFVTTAYSADTYTLAFSFLFITMCINVMCQEEPVRLSQLITLFVSISIVIMCKIAYAPLCLLIFMIPKEKYSTKIKNWASKISLVLFSGGLTLLTFLYSNSKNIVQWPIPGVDVGGQIKYILTHPITYIILICDDIKNNILGYLSGVTTSLAYNSPLKPIWIIAFVLVLCILTLIDNKSDQLILSVKNKLIIIFSVACSWGLVVTALYASFTPVGSSVVSGVQGRYWGPLIFPLLLLLKNNQIVCKADKKKINIALIVFITLALLSVMWSILYNCCW